MNNYNLNREIIKEKGSSTLERCNKRVVLLR